MEFSKSAKRNLLRFYMIDCPCCHEDDVDKISGNELDKWLESHDRRWYSLDGVYDIHSRYGTLLTRLDEVIDELNTAKTALQKMFGHDCVGYGTDKCTWCETVAKKVLEPENCK